MQSFIPKHQETLATDTCFIWNRLQVTNKDRRLRLGKVDFRQTVKNHESCSNPQTINALRRFHIYIFINMKKSHGAYEESDYHSQKHFKQKGCQSSPNWKNWNWSIYGHETWWLASHKNKSCSFHVRMTVSSTMKSKGLILFVSTEHANVCTIN